MTSPRLRRALEPALVSLIGVWALYQALGNLGSANLNADEQTYLTAGWASVHGDFTLNPEHPPTAKFLIGVAQLLFGQQMLSARIAAGACVLAGGAILYLWLRPEIGWIGALGAAGSWLLLPHGVSSGVRIDRFGLLDPFMVVFAIAASAAAWVSFRRRSWVWLAVSAACLGLAATSKVPAVVLLPAILLLPALAHPAPRAWRVAASGCLYLAIVTTVVLLVYLPVGFASLHEMIRFQSEHRDAGHLVVVGGVATTNPPWWANLLFAVEGMGIPAAIVLAIGAVAAFWPRGPRRLRVLAAYLGAGILGFWVFQFLVSGVALPHYYYDWVWLFCALLGLGLAALLRSVGSRAARRAARTAAAALVALTLAASAWSSVAISHERARDMALVLPALDRLGVAHGAILVAGLAAWEYEPYLDGREVTAADTPGVVAIAVKDSLRFPIDPAVRALLEHPGAAFKRLVLDDVTLFVDERAALTAATGSPP